MKNRLKRSVSVLLLFAILTMVMPLNANADTKFVTDDNNSISEHINNGVETEKSNSYFLWKMTAGIFGPPILKELMKYRKLMI